MLALQPRSAQQKILSGPDYRPGSPAWTFRDDGGSIHDPVPTDASKLEGCPERIIEFVTRAVDAVRTAVGVDLEFDSDTLPLLDHYIREVPSSSPDAAALIAAMTGAYFGETVRQSLGGSWKSETEDPAQWRIVLPGGLSFSPVRLALAAILENETGEGNADFQAPPQLMTELEAALEHMGTVTEREYYTLSCRFDTLEHLQEVMLAVAASRANQDPRLTDN